MKRTEWALYVFRCAVRNMYFRICPQGDYGKHLFPFLCCRRCAFLQLRFCKGVIRVARV